MKKYIPLLFLSVILLTNKSFSQTKSITFEHGTFAELLATAKKANKMIYIDCYTVWCGPCKWMAKNVFTNDTVADFYNANFISAKIDMEKGEGLELAKKYDIRAYPTMLYLNSNGEQLHRTCGSSPAAAFIISGKNALSHATQLATYTADFKAGKVNASFADTYFSMLRNACQSYSEEVKSYFSTVKAEDLRSRNNWNIIYNYIDDYSSKTFTDFEADRNIYAKLYSLDSVENKINSVYTSSLYSSIQNKDMKTYEILKTKLRASNTKDAERIIMEADVKLYQRNGDWANYAKYATEFVNKYEADNASELNSFAWTFYEHVDDVAMLRNAEVWAKHATQKDDNYPYNDTYAAVLYKLGQKSEAKVIAEKAISIAKKTGDDFKETSALLEKIELMK
jgi:thiol-disulfide isomerase/thioredoxin